MLAGMRREVNIVIDRRTVHQHTHPQKYCARRTACAETIDVFPRQQSNGDILLSSRWALPKTNDVQYLNYLDVQYVPLLTQLFCFLLLYAMIIRE